MTALPDYEVGNPSEGRGSPKVVEPRRRALSYERVRVMDILACVAERLRSLPGGGAYYTLAVVLCLDRLELEVDILREIPHEREDFAHARIHDAQGDQNIHDCARDGVGTLHRSFSSISWGHTEIRHIETHIQIC